MIGTESIGGRSSSSSIDMVMAFVRAKTMKEAFGVSPHGGDLNKWPSKTVDAFLLLQEEHNMVENMQVSRISRDQHQQGSKQPQRRNRR